MVRVQAASAVASVASDSRGLLGHFVQESLPLFSRKKLEKPRHGLQKRRWVLVIEVRPCQEVGADHFKTVTSGFVRTQHQSRRLNRLLDNRNLSLVQLEVDNLPRFPTPAPSVPSPLPA
jgi:hypothetical protein